METATLEPEREPLRFTFSTDRLLPDVAEVRIAIKEAAEKLLYHWKTFPIVLPSSITDDPGGLGDVYGHSISFKDLFIAPTFDEMEQVARDAKGNVRRLNQKQLLSIRHTGEFEVESMNFRGQVHRWHLTQLLQKGTKRAHDSLLNDTALALRIILIHARNRFYSPFLSISEGIKSIGKTIWQLLDILGGMPSTSTGNLESKLHEEHSRFLVAELNIKPDVKRDWKNFCDYIKDKSSQLEMQKTKTLNLTPPPIPYCFLTPKGNEIDMRLFNRDLMNQCTEVLKKILEQESKGWYIKYKDRIITELKGQDMTFTEIKEYVNKSIQQKYIQKVFEALMRNDELERIQPNLGALLVQQSKCALSMEKALNELKEKLTHHQQEHKSLLIQMYPVRSRIPQWVDERLQEFWNDFISQHQWSAHHQAIEDCRQQGLEQMVYFLHRDLTFMRDREPVLKKELSKVKNPNRVFRFSCRIWFPHRWVVKRHQYGEVEVVPTVVTDTPIPPSSSAQRLTGPDEPTYTVEKDVAYKTSTRLPFWRIVNYCYRTFSWTWNAMFFLGLVIPWCSPVSFRALFCFNTFMADLELNPTNGMLYPDPASRTNTLISRLHNLWAHVRRSRRDFENEPETGFLGKSFTRHFNRFWNYVLKGAFGSFLLFTVSVPVCLSASLLSLLLAFTAPLWMPLVTAVVHLGALIVYDFDHPDGTNRLFYIMEAVIFRLIIAGCLQPIVAVITAVAVLPLSAFVVFLAGCIRRSFRAVWDAFMFHAIIKKRGRVPSRDGFTVKRIAGPGLASHYFFQVRPEQALAAAEARMELHELNVWKDNFIRLIEQPKEEYRRFVEQCFGPFSASLSEDGVYKELMRETKQYLQILWKEVDQRKQKLNTGLSPDIQSRIRLTSRELKVVIAQTSKMLEDFYPEHVLRQLPKREEEFWEDRHLEQGDWQGLATQLLTEVFSSSFLSPLEDADTCFKLEVHHLNLLRYLEMLKSAEFRDDLDVVSTVHTPKGDIDVDPPYLDPQLFSPRRDPVSHVLYTEPRRRIDQRLPWKCLKKTPVSFEKLSLPLPIAHPATVAILIHNRDVDSYPINLDDIVCQQIIRATEGLLYIEIKDSNGMEMYEADGDTSTPDHTTSNSDPDVVQVHLAEQESTLSDMNIHSPEMHDMPAPGASSDTGRFAYEHRSSVGQVAYTTENPVDVATSSIIVDIEDDVRRRLLEEVKVDDIVGFEDDDDDDDETSEERSNASMIDARYTKYSKPGTL